MHVQQLFPKVHGGDVSKVRQALVVCEAGTQADLEEGDEGPVLTAQRLAKVLGGGEAVQAGLVGRDAHAAIRLKELLLACGLLHEGCWRRPQYLHHTLHLLCLILTCHTPSMHHCQYLPWLDTEAAGLTPCGGALLGIRSLPFIIGNEVLDYTVCLPSGVVIGPYCNCLLTMCLLVLVNSPSDIPTPALFKDAGRPAGGNHSMIQSMHGRLSPSMPLQLGANYTNNGNKQDQAV